MTHTVVFLISPLSPCLLLKRASRGRLKRQRGQSSLFVLFSWKRRQAQGSVGPALGTPKACHPCLSWGGDSRIFPHTDFVFFASYFFFFFFFFAVIQPYSRNEIIFFIGKITRRHRENYTSKKGFHRENYTLFNREDDDNHPEV